MDTFGKLMLNLFVGTYTHTHRADADRHIAVRDRLTFCLNLIYMLYPYVQLKNRRDSERAHCRYNGKMTNETGMCVRVQLNLSTFRSVDVLCKFPI